MTNTVAVNLRRIPRHIRDLFKSTCSRRGDVMEDVVAALMKAYVVHPEWFTVEKLAPKKRRKL